MIAFDFFVGRAMVVVQDKAVNIQVLHTVSQCVYHFFSSVKNLPQMLDVCYSF
jgi:hypothetical protein